MGIHVPVIASEVAGDISCRQKGDSGQEQSARRVPVAMKELPADGRW